MPEPRDTPKEFTGPDVELCSWCEGYFPPRNLTVTCDTCGAEYCQWCAKDIVGCRVLFNEAGESICCECPGWVE